MNTAHLWKLSSTVEKIKMSKLLKSTVFATISALAVFAAAPSYADEFVTIGTGGVTGGYYPTGGAICRIVNARRSETGLRCTVESTGGSVFNANALKRGDLELAIVQSDFQAASFEGATPFTEPFPEMRSLFSLYGEPVQVMVRADAGISSFADLAGKRVNVGDPGSGTRAMVDLVLPYAGVSVDDFTLVSELASAEQAAALCDNRIDAAFWTAAMPNGSTQEATATCGVRVLSANEPWLDEFLAANSSYSRDTVPGGLYPGMDEDIPTFGARATVVTRVDLGDDAAYEIVKSLFEALDEFKQLHPALANLQPEFMATGALTAPLHPGAERYYREIGLIK